MLRSVSCRYGDKVAAHLFIYRHRRPWLSENRAQTVTAADAKPRKVARNNAAAAEINRPAL